jgi:HSP20 family molecular chaperone IbpA
LYPPTNKHTPPKRKQPKHHPNRGPFSAADTNPASHIQTSNLSHEKMTDRASSPTPSERKRLDADARAKEQEEQSKLPYKWTQTIADLEVTIEVPGNFKGKDLDVVIKKNGVKAGIKGKEAIIEV